MSNFDPLVRPYLKWAGGKRQLMSEIQRYIPRKYATYYEPFVGAGAVLFSIQPPRAVINDYNEQLIVTYMAIRDDIDTLIELLRQHKQNTCEAYFYKLRSLDRDTEAFASLPAVQKAARLIYLNKTCFNGLYRVNMQGLFNVPYGRYKNPAIFDEESLRAVSRYLNENDITIQNGDFAQSVEDADNQAFVYFDPPYHSPDKSNFTGYQAGGFGEEEQLRLRDTFAMLSGRGTKCLLSNADTPFIRKLYKGFSIKRVKASRAINANAGGRGPVDEVLIKNW